jgi:nucleoside-diphosphate-sugar epimerase
MRILVTGAAGFIGSHVCERLLADGHDVAGIDDLSTGNAVNLDGIDLRLVTGSILDRDALAEALDFDGEGADGIVHLAAIPSVPRSVADPVASHDANATGTLRVLEAARQLDDPIVVLASSSSVYGANPTLPKHEGLATQPLSPYAVSKLATEQYAMAYQYCYGLPTRSTCASVSTLPLGRHRPWSNSRSLVPSTRAGAEANTGCRCIGFHSGRLSMSAAVNASCTRRGGPDRRTSRRSASRSSRPAHPAPLSTTARSA